jgi:putative DNA primase/helicase
MSDSLQAFRATMLATLGHAPEVIEPGPINRFSTSGRASDQAGWCKVFDDMRGGVYGCHRQFPGRVLTWSAIDRDRMTPAERTSLARQVAAAAAEREAQQRLQWADNAQRNAKLWAQCVPLVADDPVTRYLKRRGFVEVWPLPQVLRLHRALPYWSGTEKLGTFPAMVAPIIAPDGRMVALHRTYLTDAGRKADVPTVKKLTGASGPLTGASIQLHKPVRGCIGIAEGIETGLAAWCASGLPTVAAYCAGNLATYAWPPGVQRLVIFADHDRAGQEAAQALLSRAVRAGLAASVMTPTDAGADWCDVWAARGAVKVSA